MKLIIESNKKITEATNTIIEEILKSTRLLGEENPKDIQEAIRMSHEYFLQVLEDLCKRYLTIFFMTYETLRREEMRKE